MIYKSIHRLRVWGIFHALNTTIETNESEFDIHFDLLRTYCQFYDVLFAAAVGLGAAEALPYVTLDREGALQLRFFQPQL